MSVRVLALLAILGLLAFYTVYHQEQRLYRIPIVIHARSGADLTDFQLRFTVDTASLISAGHMRPDCGDIRFYDQDGAPIPYYIEPDTCNTSSTVVWVRIPYLPSGGTVIYMYYGDSSLTSASDPSAVFDVYDDFDVFDSNVWVATAGGAGYSSAYRLPSHGNYLHTRRTFSIYTSFEDVNAIPFDAYHVQGVAVLGEYFYVTTVDTSNDRAYVYKVDAQGNVLARVDVTAGTRYHPSEIDDGNGYLWFAVSEYVPNPSAPTLVVRMEPDLDYEVLFEVPDHIGAVCYGDGKLYMFNWDGEKLYVYDTSGNLLTSARRSGWGIINGCFYAGGRIYGSSQGDDRLYIIDANTLSVVAVLDLPSGYGTEGFDFADGYYIFMPDDGYIHVSRYEHVEGWGVDYRISQTGNTRRNIGFSQAFPCADSGQDHLIEHSHDRVFEGEVLSVSAASPYRETGGSVGYPYEVHTLVATSDYMQLVNHSTGNTIVITADEAGRAFPSFSGLHMGFQTWGSADSTLFIDWVRIYKYADPMPEVSLGPEELVRIPTTVTLRVS